jgi:enoyl-CoA hydratase/carnithine racemase
MRRLATAASPRVVAARDSLGVATLTLSEPGRRNALSSAMMAELTAGLEASRDARAIVLRAEGPSFCAGHDLRELKAAASEGDHAVQAIFDRCSALMRALREAPTPVIAAVHGPAFAAGCQLVATCDIVVADAANASFATPGLKIGRFCHTPAVAVVEACGGGAAGARRVARMLFTGEPIDGEEALRMGLVHELAPAGGAPAAAAAVAAQVAAASGAAVRQGKAALRESSGAPSLEQAYAIATGAMVGGSRHPDATEGCDAFLEKRAPKWTS